MDFLTIIHTCCKSPKEVEILKFLLYEATNNNRIIIKNVSQTAKNFNVARSQLNRIITALVKNNFLYKENTGLYFINPFIYMGRRVKNNEDREALQKEWYGLFNEK